MTKARKLRENPHYYSEIGFAGGEAIKAERGIEWFSKIGKLKKKPAEMKEII